MLRQVIVNSGRHGSLAPLAVKTRNSSVTAAQTLQEEWDTAKPFEEMPGPKPLPVLGNIWRFLPVIGNFPTEFTELQEQFYKNYGSIVKFSGVPGRNPMVMMYNPDDIEKVYRNEGPWPQREGIKSILYYRQVHRKDLFEGTGGALVTQGEEWFQFRTKVNQIMLQPRSTKLYVQPIDAVATDFVKRIRKIRDDKNEMPADFSNELNKWALESIVYIALDTRLGCLSDDLKPDSEPQKMIDAVQVTFDSMYKLDLRISPWRYVTTPAWRKFVIAADLFADISFKYIREAMERLKSLPEDNERELTVLEKLLARDSNPQTAVVMALDMMTAGVDTTSNSTAATLYFLSKNPDKQQKLYEEVLQYLPDRDTCVTAQKLDEMKYLKACIKEAMRLKPVAVGLARTLLKDMVLSGYRVPKGCDAVSPNYFLCRMDKYFPQAEEYIPERWLKSQDGTVPATKSTHPFVYMPFGFGPRSCLGRRFAQLEMETVLTKIIRNYKVGFNYGELKFQSRLLYQSISPLKFEFVDRDQ